MSSPKPRPHGSKPGQNLIEVSIMIALVAVVVLVGLSILGSHVSNTIAQVTCGLNNTCSSPSPAAPTNTLALSPGTTSAPAGAPDSFVATEYDSNGVLIGDVTSTSHFAITPDGSCAAASCIATVAGPHTITVTAPDGVTSHAHLDVTAGPAVALSLSPSSADIQAGATTSFTATGVDQYGNSNGIDLTSQATFTISGAGSCTSNSCTASAAGSYSVSASTTNLTTTQPASLSVTGSSLASVIISPASASIVSGQSQTYAATGLDAFGNSLGDITSTTTFTIAPSGSCVASVCQAPATGIYTVTASDSGYTATAALDVTAGAPATITVSLSASSIAAGDTTTATATGLDAFGNNAGDVTASTVFTLTPDGSCNGTLCTTTTVGPHTVHGDDSGMVATATLTVTGGSLASITLSPATATVSADGPGQSYAASGLDAYGNALGDVTTATSFSVTGGSCSGSVCSPTTAGAQTVTGTDSGHTATSTLTVTAGSLHNITINPASASITVDDTQAYTATALDAAGNPLGDVTVSTVFSINGNGTCTAASCASTTPGPYTITATYSGQTATSTLSVAAGALDHLALAPSSSSVASGGSQAYTATALDQYNNPLSPSNVTAQTTFVFTLGAGICTLATCTPSTTAGSYTVTGTDGSASGSASLQVTPGSYAALALNPASPAQTAGTAQAFTTTASDANGNPIADATASSTLSITAAPAGFASSCDDSAHTCVATGATTYTVTSTGTGTYVGHSATATLTVNPATFHNLALVLTPATISAGSSTAVSAYNVDTYGNHIGAAVTLASLTISPTTVSGITLPASCSLPAATCVAYSAASSTTITGVNSGHTSPAVNLQVNALGIDHLGVSLSPTSITAGSPTTASATGFDVYGNSLGLATAQTTFSVATNGGSCTGTACSPTTAGTQTIQGTYNLNHAVTGTATVSVASAGLTSLFITLNPTTVTAGNASTVSASGLDAYGNTLGDVTSATTFTLTRGAYTVTGAGTSNQTIKPTSAGTSFTVHGADGAATGDATLTVNAGSPSYLTLTLTPTTINAGNSTTATATGFDVNDNNLGDETSSTTFAITTGGGTCAGISCSPTTVGVQTITGTDGAATGASNVTVTHGLLTSLTISPLTQSIQAGNSLTYSATGTDAYANSWADTSSTSFTVNGSPCSGAVCTPPTSANNYNVVATDTTNGTHTASTTLTVTAAGLSAITISPATSSAFTAGSGSITYTINGLDAYGNPESGNYTSSTTFAITGTGATCAGTPPGNNVCTPSTTTGAYTVTASRSGVSNVTASINVVQAPLTSLTISPTNTSVTAGGSQAYTTTGKDAYNNASTETTNTTFSIASGTCTGGSGPGGSGPGNSSCTPSASVNTYTVTATDASTTATTSLGVTAGPLAAITISPLGASVTAGGSQAYTATSYDGHGNSLGDVTASTTFTITAGSCAGATCTPSTVAGSHTINASYTNSSTYTTSTTLTVLDPDHIVITPATSTIQAGQTQTYVASSYNSSNTLIGNVTSSTTFAITPDGSCTATTCTATVASAHTVTATYTPKNTLHATATLTFTATTTVGTITAVSPASATITAGGSGQAYTATGADQYGNAMGDITPTTTFTVTGTPTICPSALCNPTTAGSQTVTATNNGHTATASLTVNHALAASIAISPTSAAITAGGSQTYTTTSTDAYSNTWSSLSGTPTATLTISPDGSCTGASCTATNAVSHTVTAHDNTHTTTASLTINHAAATSIVIDQGNTTIRDDQTQTYTITGTDAYGNHYDATSESTFTGSGSATCGPGSGPGNNVCSFHNVGSPNITAHDGTPSASVTLTTTAGLIHSITISPTSTNAAAGLLIAFTSTGYDTYGVALGDVTAATTFSISSSPPGLCDNTYHTCGASIAGTYYVNGNDSGSVNSSASVLAVTNNGGNIVVQTSTGSAFNAASTFSQAQRFSGDRILVGDVNHDGKADLVTVTPAGAVMVQISTGTNFYPYQIWDINTVWGSVGNYLADVNGDGYPDLVTINNSTATANCAANTICVNLNLKNGSFASTSTVWESGAFYGNHNGATGNSLNTLMGDVTGDGKADIVAINNTGVWVMPSTGSSFGAGQNWDNFAYYGTRATLLGDITGNGKADLIVVNDTGIAVELSTGTGFGATTTWENGAFYGSIGTYLSDVTGDGKADVIAVNSPGSFVMTSTGSSFVSNTNWSGAAYAGYTFIGFGDFNGDGKVDLLGVT